MTQPSPEPPETQDRVPWRLLALICLAFGALRIALVGRTEVWLDEAMTWHYASMPWTDVARFVAENDVHPPLHFLLTKPFLAFGDGPVALRLAPMLAEFLALPLIAFAAWQLAPAGRKSTACLMALALAGLSAHGLWMGSLARAYAEIYLAMALCTASLAWIIAHAPRADQRMGPVLTAHAGLAIGLALMPWLHNLGLLYAAAVGLVCLVLWWVVLNRDGRAFARLALTALAAAALYLPQLPTLLRQLEPVGSNYWIKAPSLPRLAMTLVESFSQGSDLSPGTPVLLALAGLVCLVGLVLTVRLWRQNGRPAVLLLAGMPIAILTLFVLVTYLVKPVLLHRAIFPMLAPWFVLLALGAASLPTRSLRLGVFAVLAGAFLVFVLRPPVERPWIGRTLALIDRAADGRVPTVVTVPNAAAILVAYHARQAGYDIGLVPLPEPYPAHGPHYRFTTGWPGVPALNAQAMATLDAALKAQTGPVWLFLRSYWIYDPDGLLKPHLQKDFCFEPVDGLPSPLFVVVRLAPRGPGTTACETLGDGPHFPYGIEAMGIHTIEEASP